MIGTSSSSKSGRCCRALLELARGFEGEALGIVVVRLPNLKMSNSQNRQNLTQAQAKARRVVFEGISSAPDIDFPLEHTGEYKRT